MSLFTFLQAGVFRFQSFVLMTLAFILAVIENIAVCTEYKFNAILGYWF